MRILVTGGAGYVGSHTVPFLIAAGHEAWVYDNLSRGHREATDGARLIVGDLADEPRLETALRQHQIDAVLHFAAVALVGESMHDPALYYRTNVAGTLSLLSAMLRAEVRRLVFSSSTAVVGAPLQMPIAETAPRLAINPYGRSKAMVEQILEDYADAYGLSATALRYFNAAGAAPAGDRGEDHDPETHLIPATLSVALGRRSHVTLYGADFPTPDGTCIRDYVHVDDLAVAHLRALERLPPRGFRAYHLGLGRGYSNREVVETCRRVTGKHIPMLLADRRPGDPPSLIADPSRAREELDWRPQYQDLDAIVTTAWNWHRRHPWGYGGAPREGE